MANTFDVKTISAMQTGDPVATYKKTTVGKVSVKVINTFSGDLEDLVLSGDGEDSMVNLWSDVEYAYFKKANRYAIREGLIIQYDVPREPEERTMEQYNDEELRAVVNQVGLKFAKSLAEVKSLALANRILNIAREGNKSEKMINSILAKISELQG
jgi:hypothetical protein